MLKKDAIYVATCKSGVCIKVCGRGTFINSVQLRTLLNKLWESGFRKFIFDLSECEIMDSTFVGILAGFALKVARSKAGGEDCLAGFYRANEEVQKLITNLGVDKVFHNVDIKMENTAEFVASEESPLVRSELARACYEAHKILTEINPANSELFKDVIEFLEGYIKK